MSNQCTHLNEMHVKHILINVSKPSVKSGKSWGNFDFAVTKFKKCDKNFIDLGQYSRANMTLIIDELKRF